MQRGVTSGHADPLIAAEKLTLQGMLKQQGYHTAIAGKWHLNFNYEYEGEVLSPEGKGKNIKSSPINSYIPDGPLTRGFDHFFGFHHARDMRTLIRDDKVVEHIDVQDMLPRTTDFAVDYIRSQAESAKKGNPFFLYVAFGSPHTPIVPTKEWIGKSGLGKYADFVMMTDGMAGKIIAALNENGLKENTLVIFSSDNGTSKAADVIQLQNQGHYPSANLRGLKSDLWDGGHRVPFILRWPSGHNRKIDTQDKLIGLSDVMATVADITDYEVPENAAEDSISFLPLLQQDEASSTREAIVHHSIYGKFSIRQGDWKLLLSPGSGGWSKPNDKQATKAFLPAVQLYNIKNDIAEKNNLATQYPQKVTALITLLESYVERGRSTPGKALKNDADIDIWKDELNL